MAQKPDPDGIKVTGKVIQISTGKVLAGIAAGLLTVGGWFMANDTGIKSRASELSASTQAKGAVRDVEIQKITDSLETIKAKQAELALQLDSERSQTNAKLDQIYRTLIGEGRRVAFLPDPDLIGPIR